MVRAAFALVVTLAPGCSGDPNATAPSTSAAEPASGAAVSSYDSVREMADRLEAAGIGCALEYEGLRDAGKELSICTISGEQATLSIWFDPDRLAEFRSAPLSGVGATAVGGNWTVDVTSAEVATLVADALDGDVKG